MYGGSVSLKIQKFVDDSEHRSHVHNEILFQIDPHWFRGSFDVHSAYA